MRFLRTNTACRITVGPFFDKADGVTPETSLTVTNCKLTLMVDDANVPTLVIDASPTASGGNNDMVHVTGDDAGFYDLELTAAQTNYLGRAMLAITDAATHCPVFHEFMILPAMVYDSLVLGTDRLDANVTHVADTAQTAGDIIGDTNDIQSRLPATLTGGGTIKAHLVSTDELAITAGSFEPDAFYELSFGTTGNNAIVAAFGTGSGLTALATAAELAKVPKSDGTTSWNATALASIQTAAAAALTAYDPPTHTEMTAAFTEIKGATWASTDTLEAIRDRGDAAWTTATGFSTHSAADVVTALGTGSSLTSLATAAALATVATYVDTEVAAIKAKTDNLPSDPADASDIAAAFSTVNSTLTTIAGYVDTEVAAIKAKTDLIPGAPAAVSDIPTAAQNAAAILAAGDVDGYTLEQTLKLCLAALAGKLSGAATTTITIRAADDSKARITATVDASGNRSAVTLDAAG